MNALLIFTLIPMSAMAGKEKKANAADSGKSKKEKDKKSVFKRIAAWFKDLKKEFKKLEKQLKSWQKQKVYKHTRTQLHYD